MKDFYTLKEMANYLGKSYMTMIRWLHAGKFKYNKVGNIYLVHKKQVEKLKEAK